MVQRTDVTGMTPTKMKSNLLWFKKRYKNAHLKSRGTRQGRRTFIEFSGRK